MKKVLISMKMMKTSRFHCQCKIWWSSKLFSVLWFSSPAKLHSPTMAQVISFGESLYMVVSFRESVSMLVGGFAMRMISVVFR